MFDEKMINGDLIYPDDSTYSRVRCNIRLPWYRGLPLSCIERIDVAIDGAPASRDDLSLTLHGINHKLDELGSLNEVFWFVRHTAALHVRTPKPLEPGAHDMKVVMHLNIPYQAEREYPQVAACRKRVTLVRRDW
jgi:hypothetical protein